MDYKVEGVRPRRKTKKTCCEAVEGECQAQPLCKENAMEIERVNYRCGVIITKDCRARGLNTEDAMCRSRWRKQIGMIDDHNECSG